MPKRKFTHYANTANNMYRTAKGAYRLIKGRQPFKRLRTKTSIDKDMQSTSMEVARNFQVTNAKKFSKAKPQTKDFFELYNLQTAITQDTATYSTTQGRQSVNMANNFINWTQLRQMTDFASIANDRGRLYVHTLSYEMMCTNQSNWQQIIDIWDTTATAGVNSSIRDAFINAAAQNGGAGSLGIGEGNNWSGIISVRPTDLDAFTNQWRPYKHNRVYLNPGEVWIHKGFRFVNRKWDSQELIASYNDSNNAVQGLTSGCLLIQRGVPVHDAAHAVTTSGNQEIAIATTYRLRYAVIPESVSGDTLRIQFSLPTTLTTLNKMETETDNAATLENA